MDPAIHAALRRFPLIGRPRPSCPNLELRLQEVIDAVAAGEQKGEDGMHDVAHALNKAALIASDARMPDLARRLCWQHIDAYRNAGRPLTFLECRYMLEPVHNLARLQLRSGQDAPALTLLEAMHQAVTEHRNLDLENQTLPTGTLVGAPRDEQSLRRWVWLQLVGDGVRALALADRWPDAAAHARRHHVIGDHLLEGRQASIIAHLVENQPAQAAISLVATVLAEPWENEVAPCFHAMCAAAGDSERAAGQHLDVALARLRARKQGPQYSSYRTRLGLTIAILAQPTRPDFSAGVAVQTAEEAIDCVDGYAARDVLGCKELVPAVTSRQRAALARIAQECGLAGPLPDTIRTKLLGTAEQAAGVLGSVLKSVDLDHSSDPMDAETENDEQRHGSHAAPGEAVQLPVHRYGDADA
ncbi:hypothetical protein OHA21_00040 [Actinoplanes sp. NBC_00393]|uniref:hypothetical protein n=1 Tax=Actinoplanes sp. NBC_00393 TaxID=2975953 RepID=UPI002E1A617B